MQVASQHAETVGERSGIGVKKRLLLHWIALHAADVSPGYIQLAAAIEANFADTELAFGNRAAMATGVAAHPVAIEFFVEIAFADILLEQLAEGSHGDSCIYFSAAGRGKCGDQRDPLA